MTSLNVSMQLFLVLLFVLSIIDLSYVGSEETRESQCLNDDASKTCDNPSEEAAGNSMIDSSATVSPTAHYTAYVFYKNGLSAPGLYTLRGWFYYYLLRPFDWFVSTDTLFDGGLSLETHIMQRHIMIDYLLEQKIKSGEVTQVVELACGLSSRGYRLTRKYPHVNYIETDLTSMIETKRKIFTNANMLRENHKLMMLDALYDVDYSKKLKDLLMPSSDNAQNDEGGGGCSGTAVITEGLIGYFNREDAEKIVTNVFTFLKKMSGGADGCPGMYLSDVLIATYFEESIFALFIRLLGSYINRKLELPLRSDEDVLQMTRNSGADDASLHNPEDYDNNIEDGKKVGDYPKITSIKSEKNTRGLIRVLEGSIG